MHGLGFAARARSDIGLGAHGTSIVGPLVAFNLGVEIGQLAVAAPLLALLWKLRAVARVRAPRRARGFLDRRRFRDLSGSCNDL